MQHHGFANPYHHHHDQHAMTTTVTASPPHRLLHLGAVLLPQTTFASMYDDYVDGVEEEKSGAPVSFSTFKRTVAERLAHLDVTIKRKSSMANKCTTCCSLKGVCARALCCVCAHAHACMCACTYCVCACVRACVCVRARVCFAFPKMCF